MKSLHQAIQESPSLKKYKPMEWNEHSIKNFWDFESLFPKKYFTYQHGKNLLELIHPYIKSNDKALDYGAGNGFFTEQLLKRNIQTATFDLSTESSEASTNKFQNHPSYLGAFDNNSITNQESKFDIIFLLEVAEHLDNTTRSSVLNQIHRLLKKDGILVVSTPNEENLTDNLILNPLTMEIFHRWQHCFSWSAESLSKTIEKSNFTTIKTIEINLKHAGQSPIKRMKRLLKKGGKQPHLIVISKKTK